MSDTDRNDLERLARAERLAAKVGPVRLPYPWQEATDPMDAALLYMVENMGNPQWLAENWLRPDPPEDPDGR